MHKSTPDTSGKNSNTDISALRQAIDEIDDNIMGLINRRLLLAQQIGRVKKKGAIPVTDRQREKEIIDRLRHKNSGLLSADGLRQIFAAIIAEGRNIQKTD